MVEHSLSFSDLVLVDGFKKAVMEQDIQTVQRILFENGMDITKKVNIVSCNHRNLQGKVFNGPRYEGFERLDVEWVKSGAASMDAIIESSNDPHMRVKPRTMSKQVQQDKAWEN